MLWEFFSSFDRVPVVPIVGYPILREIGLTSKDCLTNPDIHLKVLEYEEKVLKLDAILPLLDLTIEAEVLGAEVDFPDYDAPKIRRTVKIEDIRKVKKEGRISAMVEVIRKAKEKISKVPIGAYVIGPFTLVGQLIEITNLLKSVIRSPESLPPVLNVATEVCIDYGKRLKEAGADFLVIAEPSSSLISAEQYRKFSKPYLEKLIGEVGLDVVLHICGRSGHLIREMVKSKARAISIDQNVPLGMAINSVPKDVLVFGNYPPSNLIFEDIKTIEGNVRKMVEDVKDRRNYVASTGCDVPSSAPIESVKAFIESCKKFKRDSLSTLT